MSLTLTFLIGSFFSVKVGFLTCVKGDHTEGERGEAGEALKLSSAENSREAGNAADRRPQRRSQMSETDVFSCH